MDKPNEFLLATAEQYPELADNLRAVTDYIDNLRHACGVAKNHLDQIIGAARLGIIESEKIWTPSLGETVEWKREGQTPADPQNTADPGEEIDIPSTVKSPDVSKPRDFGTFDMIDFAARAIAHFDHNKDAWRLYTNFARDAVAAIQDTPNDTTVGSTPNSVPVSTPGDDSANAAEGTQWRDINTLPDSDDLIWLRKGNTYEGPRPASPFDADEFDEWALCEPPK